MPSARPRKTFRPSLDILSSRILPSGFNAPAPLQPSEMEQPPLEMPATPDSTTSYGPLDLAPPSCTVDTSSGGSIPDTIPMTSFASLG